MPSHWHGEKVTLIVKKRFLDVQREPPLFLFVSLASLVLPLNTTEQNLALLLHPLQEFIALTRSSWAFSSPGRTVPSLSEFPHRRERKTDKKRKIFEKGKRFLLSFRFKQVSQTGKRIDKLTDKLKLFWGYRIACNCTIHFFKRYLPNISALASWEIRLQIFATDHLVFLSHPTVTPIINKCIFHEEFIMNCHYISYSKLLFFFLS